MTVIVTDGKVMAADSLTTFGGERSLKPTDKLRLRGGRVFGVSGIVGMIDDIVDWYCKEPRDPKEAPKAEGEQWSMLVLEPDGRIFHVHSCSCRPHEVAAPFTIGSGSEYALGAMLAGASPARAVEIACHLSTTCGLPVNQIARVELEPQLDTLPPVETWPRAPQGPTVLLNGQGQAA